MALDLELCVNIRLKRGVIVLSFSMITLHLHLCSIRRSSLFLAVKHGLRSTYMTPPLVTVSFREDFAECHL